jgi:hypothetical protein
MPLKHSQIFQNALEKYCKDRLPANIIMTLANVLSMDFDLRGENQDINTYPEACAQKVSIHLGDVVFKSENFEGILTLFAAAITNNTDSKTDESQLQTGKDRALLQQIFQNLSELHKLADEEKNILIDDLLQLKTVDPQIDFNVLAKHSKIFSGRIAHLLSQSTQKKAEIIEEMLALIKVKNQGKKSGFVRSRNN